jgi:hypothetical protein
MISIMANPISFTADTDINNDSRNFGLVNSIIYQQFNNGPVLASVLFALLCAILILGAVLTYVLLRQVTHHGRILIVQEQRLELLTAHMSAALPVGPEAV